MNFARHAIGFLVALLVVMIVGVAWLHFSQVHLTGKTVLFGLSALSVLGGVVSISYTNPTAVAPTALTALPVSKVVALVSMADADLLATITHNFNIPLASTPSQHGQNSGNPWVTMTLDTSSAGTVAPVLSFVRGTNTIVIKKTSVVGTNCTIEVVVQRHELIQ